MLITRRNFIYGIAKQPFAKLFFISLAVSTDEWMNDDDDNDNENDKRLEQIENEWKGKEEKPFVPCH